MHGTKVDPRKWDNKRVEDGEYDDDHHDQDVIGEPNCQVEPGEYQYFTKEDRRRTIKADQARPGANLPPSERSRGHSTRVNEQR